MSEEIVQTTEDVRPKLQTGKAIFHIFSEKRQKIDEYKQHLQGIIKRCYTEESIKDECVKYLTEDELSKVRGYATDLAVIVIGRFNIIIVVNYLVYVVNYDVNYLVYVGNYLVYAMKYFRCC